MGIALLCLMAVALLVASATQAYNILGIFPTAAKSHYIVGEALMRSLATDGHNVTVISPFPQQTPIANYHDYPIVGIVEEMQKKMPDLYDFYGKSVYQQTTEMYAMGLLYTNYTLKHSRMTEFLQRDTDQYDVVICEIFLNEAMLGLGAHFRAPVIGLAAFGATMWTKDMVGSPAPLSYVPSRLLSLPDRMSFAQRVGNTFLSALDRYIYSQYLTHQEHLYQEVFQGNSIKTTLEQIRKNVSLVLVNQHISTSFPQPYAPNMIDVGGLHIRRGVPKALPDDIRRFVDEASHGVVYFSLGTNIQSSELPTKTRDHLLRVFGRLKQRVLWKWEAPDLPGKPDNVMVRAWFPQQDVLANDNVNVFITNGGLLSLTEAVYHGVPLVGIPFFGDQFLNMLRAERAGYGVTVAYANLTDKSIDWALSEVLGNERFALQAKAASELFRDQPLKPLQLAKYWVEYVARHRGAPHLRSAGQDLPFIMYHNLDVFIFIALAIGFVVYLILWIFKSVKNFGRKNANNGKDKVKNSERKKRK